MRPRFSVSYLSIVDVVLVILLGGVFYMSAVFEVLRHGRIGNQPFVNNTVI